MATKKSNPKPEPKAEPRTSKAEGYTATNLAESLGIAPADLRKHLRNASVEKPGASWVWPNEKAAAAARKAVEGQIKEAASKPAKEPKAKAEPAPKSKPAKPAKKPSAK